MATLQGIHGSALTPVTPRFCWFQTPAGSEEETTQWDSVAEGLSLGQRTCVQTGTIPIPTVLSEPESLIPLGSSVTIWCQGTAGGKEFELYKEEKHSIWNAHAVEAHQQVQILHHKHDRA
ncbi:leukocyte immunoglobulin-like receptor subfamily B member 3-like [Saccopteryx leptura]|uniref:leukocyte immunoglobulin-like receptor subfamily B member 3-like n=1 Tax=Saccopteryx leptura TaxID=249018 RepID=UPI00339C3C0B